MAQTDIEKEIENNEKVIGIIERTNMRTGAVTQDEMKAISSLQYRMRLHHPLTYLESLKTGLTSLKIFIEMHLPHRAGLYGGLLQNVGTLRIPTEILDKTFVQGQYTDEDHKVMKAHSLMGYEILMNHGLPDLAVIALTQHRFNLKDPYPSESVMPPFPEQFQSDGARAGIMFYSRMISLASQYTAFRRPNSRNGDKPLDRNEVKALMLKENLDQSYTIDRLFAQEKEIF